MMLQRLHTFIEVYRQRSISAAARSLGITQPAASQHLAGLEATIGRQLFERTATGVLPTVAAEELAAQLGDSLDIAEAALAAVRARSEELAGAIQIAGHLDFLAEVVGPLFRPLLDRGMRIRLHGAIAHGSRKWSSTANATWALPPIQSMIDACAASTFGMSP
ncbi:LysR family transcriptional regulator [Novosphingobium sp. 9]|uniref:LysR family transcriptional regulator n=1 Tax=Novosphingobium sp. 9 TaxID=2025349 RepID=UPI0021B694DF|nr:LysR family transcriptional regulator [Novosphingobium sp. 9]